MSAAVSPRATRRRSPPGSPCRLPDHAACCRREWITRAALRRPRRRTACPAATAPRPLWEWRAAPMACAPRHGRCSGRARIPGRGAAARHVGAGVARHLEIEAVAVVAARRRTEVSDLGFPAGEADGADDLHAQAGAQRTTVQISRKMTSRIWVTQCPEAGGAGRC
jgi:hypothetical protein